MNIETPRTTSPGPSPDAAQRTRAHAAKLFNDGLEAARAGCPARARDCFAAVVQWYPHDLEAMGAMALACLESDDAEQARAHWEYVLARRPRDARALRGMEMLDGKSPEALSDVDTALSWTEP
jgi:hypothetical protein